ncbi:DUF6382 domain-containing protein [Cohnella hashimotonis]|uniref:DUF6382 domain-containing protein n=1 Tax=Cohnella hashimotonis TaxID=2826895 RepID=A0ABT6TMU0_9BACL|nr:DUF6382 domain-containing protein [Cohnella hashimotonis]MDI4647244.1 DUF6382 domain-containing protein [Cohnella hashimotonis]
MTELKTRFEQQRGLWMILERAPAPWRREDLDAVQTGMLQACEIPGLLPLSVEETDERIGLRYRLAGSKMLSQSLRSERWTMTDAIAALCKLAETAEQCHDHMLDFKRLLLRDEYIFAGSGWHDLRFAYLPLAANAAAEDEAGLERLIVRWVMRADNPDGAVLQRLLEMTAAEGFEPSSLRAFARRYLCERAEERIGSMVQTTNSGEKCFAGSEQAAKPAALQPERKSTAEALGELSRLDRAGFPPYKASARQEEEAPEAAWQRPDAFRSGRAQDAVPVRNKDDAPAAAGFMPGGMSAARWRIWLVALSAVAAGTAWKTLYAGAPGTRGLALSLGATAACAGLCLFFWNGWTRKEPKEPRREVAGDSKAREQEPDRLAAFPARPDPNASPGKADGALIAVPALRFDAFSDASGSKRNDSADLSLDDRPQTEWLPAKREATELLVSPQAPAPAACYLEWESAERPCKIPLKAESLVIGRSREAAQHVDESGGMSRAHLEMLRQQGRWLAKDLGSRNGSWLNGSPMAPYEAYPLEAGDCLQMAGSIYRFHVPSEPLRA